MKRYEIYIGQDRSGDPVLIREEFPNGDWVDFDDAQAEIDRLQGVIDSAHAAARLGDEDTSLRILEANAKSRDSGEQR